MNAKDTGCIIMASGLSARYGRDKLLERLGGRAVILHAADHLLEAGLIPLIVTRSEAVRALAAAAGVRCVLHGGARKSDTIRAGLLHLDPEAPGVLFMPGDQPLVRPGSILKMVEHFRRNPARAVRLGFRDEAGSPVLFPAALREDLLAYAGDRGGVEVLRATGTPCDVVQAEHAWELWDVDTPEMMARVAEVYKKLRWN